MKADKTDDPGLTETLNRLEARISRLESYLGLTSGEPATSGTALLQDRQAGDVSGIEMKIGEFGLAWIGTVIFSLGIVFLVTYIHNLGYGVPATLLGYFSAAALFLMARRWTDTYSHLSRITIASSLALIFYTTIRLHFFSTGKVVSSRPLAIGLLLLVVCLQFALSIRQSRQWMAAMATLFGLISSVLIDQTHLSLPVVTIQAMTVSALAVLRDWHRLLIGTIIATYFTHLIWLLNNPVLGHPLKGVENHQFNLIYLFLYALAFAAATLSTRKLKAGAGLTVIIILINCLGFSVTSLLVTLTHYQTHYAMIYLGVAGMFLGVSITQWLRTRSQAAAAAYACFGYLGLSIAIYGYTCPPASFLWLSLQSLLVVSMALWFRSKELVVVNTLIFLGIVGAYTLTSPASSTVDFTFVVAAHLSARVMNWQKERLTLRTEMLRNIYLLTAFGLVLIAVYRIAPSQYVTLFWTMAAVVYFSLSAFLKNVKYRWIAMGILLVTVIHLFLVDLARLDPSYRVIAFLFLGLMSVVLSLFYTKIRRLISRN